MSSSSDPPLAHQYFARLRNTTQRAARMAAAAGEQQGEGSQHGEGSQAEGGSPEKLEAADHERRIREMIEAEGDLRQVLSRKRGREWIAGRRAVKRSLRSMERQRGEDEAQQRRAQEQLRAQEGMLEKLVAGLLPQELVVCILEHIVDARAPHLFLDDEHALPNTAARLLGTSASAQTLHPLIHRLILERSRIRIHVPFTRKTGGGDPIAQIPPFVHALPRAIRHLDLTYDAGEIRGSRLTYPIAIFRLTRGAASLAQALPSAPDLRSLTLNLHFDIEGKSLVDELNARCLCGYTATTTYRELLLKMLDAIHAHAPGRRKTLRFTVDMGCNGREGEGEPIPLEPQHAPAAAASADGEEAEEPPHPMAHVLDRACAVREHNTKNAKQARQDMDEPREAVALVDLSAPPPYISRANEDMQMLEDT